MTTDLYDIFTTFVVYNTKLGVFATKLSGIQTLAAFKIEEIA